MNEDKATRYHRQKRRASVVSILWGVLLLAGLTATGWSIVLRDTAERLARGAAPMSWVAPSTVFVFVVLLSILNEIAGLPLAFYSGFILERQYDLSKETPGRWLADQAKSFGIGVLLGAVAAIAVDKWRRRRRRVPPTP